MSSYDEKSMRPQDQRERFRLTPKLRNKIIELSNAGES
jgi:hypothetical protein